VRGCLLVRPSFYTFIVLEAVLIYSPPFPYFPLTFSFPLSSISPAVYDTLDLRTAAEGAKSLSGVVSSGIECVLFLSLFSAPSLQTSRQFTIADPPRRPAHRFAQAVSEHNKILKVERRLLQH
jgi:hypothetical protein